MNLPNARSSFSERMSEVRQNYSSLREVEIELFRSLNSNPSLADLPKHHLSARGLFFVHLYGLFEFSINAGVSEYLRIVENRKLPIKNYTDRALLYAINSKFQALESIANSSNTFNKRKEFLDALCIEDPTKLDESMFAKNLQNIGSKEFARLFEWLDLKQNPFPDELLTKKGFLDLVVECRRKVSHGRETPSVVGVEVGRMDDIKLALDAINDYIEYFFNCVELHVTDNSFELSANT